jgi:hypothetical protein
MIYQSILPLSYHTFVEVILFAGAMSSQHFTVVRRKDYQRVVGGIAQGFHQETDFLVDFLNESVVEGCPLLHLFGILHKWSKGGEINPDEGRM